MGRCQALPLTCGFRGASCDRRVWGSSGLMPPSGGDTAMVGHQEWCKLLFNIWILTFLLGFLQPAVCVPPRLRLEQAPLPSEGSFLVSSACHSCFMHSSRLVFSSHPGSPTLLLCDQCPSSLYCMCTACSSRATASSNQRLSRNPKICKWENCTYWTCLEPSSLLPSPHSTARLFSISLIWYMKYNKLYRNGRSSLEEFNSKYCDIVWHSGFEHLRVLVPTLHEHYSLIIACIHIEAC